MPEFMTVFGIWLGAFFTLSIFSFLYKDNPFYKLAEQIFVGLSAGYWLIYSIFNVLVPNLITKLFFDFGNNIILLVPLALGIMMLFRIIPSTQWVSRYPIAIVVGTSAAIAMLRTMQTNLLTQVTATMVNPFQFSSPVAIVGTILVILGTICGIYFFYFSGKQEGIYAVPSKIGIWFLMISFGASFGYTVMARISLLIGRLDFLLRDWLHIIK